MEVCLERRESPRACAKSGPRLGWLHTASVGLPPPFVLLRGPAQLGTTHTKALLSPQACLVWNVKQDRNRRVYVLNVPVSPPLLSA